MAGAGAAVSRRSDDRSRTLTLATRQIGQTSIATAVGAGDWIFLNGIKGLDDDGRSVLDSLDEPLMGDVPARVEATAMLAEMQACLAATNSTPDRLVRIDQFYSDWRGVGHYQGVRNAVMTSYIPPSTSILQRGHATPGARMEVDAIAVRSGSPVAIEPVHPEGLEVPAGAGFSPVMEAGDFAFVAGMMAAWKPGDLGGIAPEARVPPGHLWKGTRIVLETTYLLERKIRPALEAIGATPEDILKANVFLRDMTDAPAFNRSWSQFVGGRGGAVTIAPTTDPGFAIEDATLEVNVVARRPGAPPIERIALSGFRGLPDQPAAVRCGDFVFVSGLTAGNNPRHRGRRERLHAHPFHGSSIALQMESILEVVEELCAQAGAPLTNIVRIRQYHLDLREFFETYRAWSSRFSGQAVPVSATEAPGPLPGAESTVLVDLWLYAPGSAAIRTSDPGA